MFDFEYKSEYKTLSYDLSGSTIDYPNEQNFIKIKKNFLENGYVVFQCTNSDKDEILKIHNDICSLIGRNQIRDATRRTSNSAFKANFKQNAVDPDEVHRPHSETSFSPARPAVVSFVCIDIENDASLDGLTTLIDGFQLWKDLNIKTKNSLLSGEIEYRLSVDTPLLKKLPKGKRPWYLEYNGVKNVELDGDNNKINFDYKTSFVTEHPLNRSLSIANHSFIDIKTEPQIINRLVNLSLDNSKTLSLIREDIHNCLNKNISTFKWQKGLILILDNFRYMHGRLPYNLDLKRKLFITQFRNFNL